MIELTQRVQGVVILAGNLNPIWIWIPLFFMDSVEFECVYKLSKPTLSDA